MKRVDMVKLVETAYRLDLDLTSWLEQLAQDVSPELDFGFGVAGMLIRFHAPFAMEPVGPVVMFRGPNELGERHRAMNVGTPPHLVKALWLTGSALRSGSERIPTAQHVLDEHSGPFPIADGCGIAALDGEGYGLSLSGAVSRRVTTSKADRARWEPVASHLAAGLRLRRRLSVEGEALFTPEGKCLDANGDAANADARESLRAAVRNVEKSRGPMRRRDPEGALRLWRGLVSGRWSLVDSFSSDGKRFIVARRNEPRREDPRALTERERQTVSFAAAGEANKQIGYRLGLATSTVGSHLMAAARKLGVQNRSDFCRFHAVNSDAAELLRLSVANEPLAALVLPTNRRALERADLTAAEREVAEALLAGASNASIAARRKTSNRTVANQVASLLRKCGATSRAELVAKMSASTK